ncbi:MAG: hypothetical protein M1833_003918 [Piccolia ochrophora]|nr:MAG: hypothetical protein M1833_003918 [Piccolia ochrophora]
MGLFQKTIHRDTARREGGAQSRGSVERPGTASRPDATKVEAVSSTASHPAKTVSPSSKRDRDDGHGVRRLGFLRPNKKEPARPAPPLQRQLSVKTHYVDMLLNLDDIPKSHNILASFFTWILLAGYVIFPGTFTTLQRSGKIKEETDDNKIENAVYRTVRNAPLLWVAAICCVIGGCGMFGLWMRWRRNYVWLINRIFLPGLLNSLAGLISTLVNVYTARDGNFSVTAKATVGVTGACTLIFLVLFLLYNNWALDKVKQRHQRDMDAMPPTTDEGTMEKIQRKVHEPGLEPSSVV